MSKMRCGAYVYVCEQYQKDVVKSLHYKTDLLFMCRDTSVYDCGYCAFPFPFSYGEILLEDMITRCYISPVNK